MRSNFLTRQDNTITTNSDNSYLIKREFYVNNLIIKAIYYLHAVKKMMLIYYCKIVG